jgi:3-oxoacyl-[acyl-carrier protein] reductase
MSDPQPLAGKVALVTGASRGIGRAIAERLGADGAHVVVNYRTEHKQADATAARIQKNNVRAVAVQADVSKTEDIRKLFKTTIDQFGALDILVNNAGMALPRRPPIEEVTDEEYDRLFAVNARGVFMALREAARWVADGGRIVNLTSTVNAMALPGYSVYAGTKAAVEIFTRTFAKELSGKRITVNAVAPGPVETELFNEGKTEADKKRMAEMCPMGRLGRPEDIAGVVAFLAGPDGGWVNGQILLANGGLA